MTDESYVQVATDGSGKKVRNRRLTEPQAVDTAGAAQADLVRYQQAVTLADGEGRILDDPNALLAVLSAKADLTNELLGAILEALTT